MEEEADADDQLGDDGDTAHQLVAHSARLETLFGRSSVVKNTGPANAEEEGHDPTHSSIDKVGKRVS